MKKLQRYYRGHTTRPKDPKDADANAEVEQIATEDEQIATEDDQLNI